MSNPQQLVQKLWNYCNILRDDSLSYGDHVEQLAFLLFLKVADEQAKPSYVKGAEPSRLCSLETTQRRNAAATVRHIWQNVLAKVDDDLSAVADEASA